MIVRFAEIEGKVMENPRGGHGKMTAFPFDAVKQFGGQVKMFATVEVQPGTMIGYHQHVDDMEIYLMLDGSAVVSDNGTMDILNSGDMLITKKGESHSLENKNNEPVYFIGIILSQED